MVRADEDRPAVACAGERLVCLRLEVGAGDVAARLGRPLVAAILVVCRATDGYASDVELPSNTFFVACCDVLLVSSEKIAETTSETKSPTDEMS